MKDYIELKNGSTLHLLPISQVQLQKVILATEAKFKAEGEPLEPPTYDDGLGGQIPWDQASVEKDGTDDEKAAWELHEAAKTRLALAQQEATTYLVLVDGTALLETRGGAEIDLLIDDTIDEWVAPKGWLARCDRQNIILPHSGSDLKFEYLNNLIPSVAKIREIISICATLTMRGTLSEEDLDAVQGTFLGDMEQTSQDAGEKVAAALEKFDKVSQGTEQE